jgi:putative nucleotidyltransferase with HDIG domain
MAIHLFGRPSARSRAIREDVQEAEAQRRTDGRTLWHVVGIAAVFYVLAAALMIVPDHSPPVVVDHRSPMDLYSPLSFSVVDEEHTAAAQLAARENAPPVLMANQDALDRAESQIVDLRQDVNGAPTLAQVPQETRQRWPNLSPEALGWLRGTDAATYEMKVRLLMETLRKTPLVDRATAKLVNERRSLTALVGSTTEKPVAINKLDVIALDPGDMSSYMKLRTVVGLTFPSQTMGDVLATYLLHTPTPTYRYDRALTERATEEVVKAVSVAQVHVEANQRIVAKGQVVAPTDETLLKEANARFYEQRVTDEPGAYWLTLMGRLLTVLIITAAMTLYAVRINPQVQRFSRAWALCGLMLITLALARVGIAIFSVEYLYFFGVFPTLLTAIILIIAFNQRFALGMAGLHALLVTLVLGRDLMFCIPILTGIAIFVLGLKEIRKRGRLIEMGALAAAAIALTVCALGAMHTLGDFWDVRFIEALDPLTLLKDAGYAGAAAIFTGFVVSGILPFIEKIFRITTSMTLLELADANHTLLQRLATEAPGTFNHSLILGTLAEAAATSIGANGLLARVGAYYHDVGKLSKPHYFIENQGGGPNRHDKLSPAMSLLIILGHVKDGIELARQYGLPWVVRQFIAEHHGTTLVEYFFHAARRKAEKNTDQSPVHETEFRYPGPRPQSREAAVIMICDGVESITRSLPDQTPGRLEAVTHQLIMKRLLDHQFDDCDLTLKDLTAIEHALVKTLAGVYHGRTAYPKSSVEAEAQRA